LARSSRAAAKDETLDTAVIAVAGLILPAIGYHPQLGSD
jgi:hypothetical protein